MSDEPNVAAECFALVREALARTDLAIEQTNKAINAAQEAVELARYWYDRAMKAEAAGTRDKAVSTEPGDLDVCGRELRPGS